MNQAPGESTDSEKVAPPTSSGGIQTSTAVPGGSERMLKLGICLGLALAVWMVFGQTREFGFVNYDDSVYVYENPQVGQGLSWGGVAWAFSHSVNYNWQPLTMLSYMLDCQLHGLEPGGYHLTNVLLHGATTILLFLVLQQMTGTLRRSAFVAALFAVHPLRVESVAWVAERKDVLSGLFFVLTLGAYVWYTREPRRWFRYLLVAFCFALALMSKPTVVPLPFLLLLLDYWPLNRFVRTDNGPNRGSPLARLILEKIPLLGLSAAGCLATLATQEKIIASWPFSLRIGNACASCAIYLWQMVYPSDLAAYYPLRQHGLPLWEVLGSLLLLTLITLLGFAWRHRRPWLLVGWLWNLGMLAPVIGLVQSGERAHADRYTYLPQIGLYLIIAWAAAALVAGRRHRRWLVGGLASTALVTLMFLARNQVSYWMDSTTLWEHTLAVSGDSDVAHNNLGMALLEKGKLDEAIKQYQQALKVSPDYYSAHENLGVALAQKGQLHEAMAQFLQAIEIYRHDALAYNNLGLALVQKGQWDEAITQYQQALTINPDFETAHVNLGIALGQKGRLDAAIAQYQQALKINPNNASAHNHLGDALLQNGQRKEAIGHYLRALEINPDLDMAHFNLGNALFREGKVDEAIAQYQSTLKLNPDFATAHNDLGIALDKKGQLDAAAAQFKQALKINPDYALGHFNLGNVLLHQGKMDEAIAQYQLALKANPNLEPAHNSLGYVLMQKGQWDEAIGHYERALELNPGNAGRCNRLAWALATHPDASVRNGGKAVQLAQQLNRLAGGKDASILQTLAAAYAETGKFSGAITTARQALQIASDRNDAALVTNLQQQIEGYRANRPFRDASLTNAAAFPHP